MNAADLELIQRELDNENAPDERERLQKLLATDAEARASFDELKLVATELEDLPLSDPPPQLWANVMDALPDEPRGRPSHGAALLQDLRAALSARPALAYGYAFGIGLLVGVALIALVGGERTGADDLYGILMSDGEASESAEVYESALELPGFVAAVKIYATNALLVVDMDVEADEATDVRLLPADALILKGLTRQTGTTAMSVETAGGTVDMHVFGVERYIVLFERPDGSIPPLQFEIWRNGEQLYAERAQPGV